MCGGLDCLWDESGAPGPHVLGWRGGSAHLAGRVPVPVSRSLCIAGQLDTLTLGSWRASRSSWLSLGVWGSLQGGAQGHATIQALGWVGG